MTEQPNYLAYIRKRQKLIPKDDAVKVLTQYVSKFGTLSSGHRCAIQMKVKNQGWRDILGRLNIVQSYPLILPTSPLILLTCINRHCHFLQ